MLFFLLSVGNSCPTLRCTRTLSRTATAATRLMTAAAAAVYPVSYWTLEHLLLPVGANLEFHAGLLEVGRREMQLKHCDTLTV